MNDRPARPKISVLLAVCNGAEFLDRALASIVAQTLSDFEVIAVDDGSGDESPAILARWARQDPRIIVLRQENRGLAAALNRAAAEARGEFWARMDADDTSMPDRFFAQVSFLDREREIGICGAAVRIIGGLRPYVHRYWRDDAHCRSSLVFESPLAHPAVMMRASLMRTLGTSLYREELRRAQDYDLWDRASSHTKMANLPEVLLDYRMKPTIGNSTDMVGRANAASVRTRVLQRLGIVCSAREAELHEAISTLTQTNEAAFFSQGSSWFERLARANAESASFPTVAFEDVLRSRWLDLCRIVQPTSLASWRIYRRSRFAKITRIGLDRQLRFCLQCLRGGRGYLPWNGRKHA